MTQIIAQMKERVAQRDSISPWLIVALAATAVAAIAALVWRRRRWLPFEEQVVEMDPLVPQADLPPVEERERPNGASRPLQPPSSGVGLVFHRRYRVDIAHAQRDGAALIADIKQNLSSYFPPLFVRIEKTVGTAEAFADEDEYYLHLVGPWDAPVRVIEESPTSFTFFTLRGHMEAGEIRFCFPDHPEDRDVLRFEIVSWARSRDQFLDFIYAHVPIMRWPQTQLWTYFCSRVVEKSGGEPVGKIQILTQKAPFRPETAGDETAAADDAPPWEVYRRRIDQLQQQGINFDLEKRHSYTQESGWNIDAYCAPLPEEAPGEPVAGGSWEIAREIIYNYEFPDPDLIVGIFPPDVLLEDRVILLKARFLGITFYFGARVGEVIDEVRHVEGRGDVRVWGYSYRTLEGHIEKGEMTFTVWKFLDSGEVEFHIDAYSRGAGTGNLFYRLGWNVFGRWLQKRYAQQAQERMQQMVIRRLRGAEPITETPQVQRADENAEAAARVEELEERV